MVAPPGKSLHRLGTELDLGPPSAYGWLARNARRFHFVQRYSWEQWHYELPLAAYAGVSCPETKRADSGSEGKAPY
jgi:LAS superfamily LD-carboxypeptidase LdcB